MKRKLIRNQLDVSLQKFDSLRKTTPPQKGWIRAIRDALGMTARQLADRLEVSQQAVAQLEKNEMTGSVTVKTMRRVAEELDCQFVYGFVPKNSLEGYIHKQARQLAVKRLSQVIHTMALEDQALGNDENQQILSEMIDEMIRDVPSDLWDA